MNIKFELGPRTYMIPNCWESLTPTLYLSLCELLQQWSTGSISYSEVRIKYVCAALDINTSKIQADLAYQNIYFLSQQVSFIFNHNYPVEAIKGLEKQDKLHLKKIAPEHFPNKMLRSFLSKQKYTYTIDACFSQQLLPIVIINNTTYHGYDICTSYGIISSTLTAMQFIDAYQLISLGPNMYPLMASILYAPGIYNSEQAHKLATTFEKLSTAQLFAITLNFQSFCSYLFTQTQFSILMQSNGKQNNTISTGMAESLFNLSNDGLGDAATIERMPIVKYLLILRKKLIESIHAMHQGKIDLLEISERTGLTINTIKQII